MIPEICGAGAAVPVAVEACHGGLGEEGEGLFEDVERGVGGHFGGGGEGSLDWKLGGSYDCCEKDEEGEEIG